MATDEEDKHSPYEKMGFDDGATSPTLLPWDKFQNWIHCVCIVTFDLEIGQAMEVKYPYTFGVFSRNIQ